MDPRNSPVDVPHMKLAKVGKDRDRKRGVAWLGARSASSFGGAGAGAGGAMGAGMSMSKLLMVLLVSGGASLGAWQMGNRLSAKSAAGAKPDAPRVFIDKGPRAYADASGVVKAERLIPNSLGYVNNDGLTDEQRAAKRAAEDAASRKAAEDARIQSDADAKKQAAEDARTASAPEPVAPGAPAAASALENAKKELAGGRFGGMSSSLGGGGALSGGAGLSGGISRSFGGMGGGGLGKGQDGVLSAFRNKAARPSLARTGARAHAASDRKGAAKEQLYATNVLSRGALAQRSVESVAAGADTAFAGSKDQGTKISGPGTGAGPQAGPVPTGNSDTSNQGGGAIDDSGSGGGGPACKDVNYEPDADGNCTKRTENPKGIDATPFKGELDLVAEILAGIAIASILLMGAKFLPPPYNLYATYALGTIIALAAITLIVMGAKIAVMEHGDYVTGGIIAAIGTFVGAMAVVTMGQATADAAALSEQAASDTFKIAGEQLAAPTPALASSVDSAAAASAVPGPIPLPSPEGLGLLV